MYLMRELLGMQLVEIGAAFGGRDHSTVIHSLERVSADDEGGAVFRAAGRQDSSLLEGLRRMLNNRTVFST